jgi:hypothetical protein
MSCNFVSFFYNLSSNQYHFFIKIGVVMSSVTRSKTLDMAKAFEAQAAQTSKSSNASRSAQVFQSAKPSQTAQASKISKAPQYARFSPPVQSSQRSKSLQSEAAKAAQAARALQKETARALQKETDLRTLEDIVKDTSMQMPELTLLRVELRRRVMPDYPIDVSEEAVSLLKATCALLWAEIKLGGNPSDEEIEACAIEYIEKNC